MRNFPGGPVVKTPSFQCRCLGFEPTCHVMWPSFFFKKEEQNRKNHLRHLEPSPQHLVPKGIKQVLWKECKKKPIIVGSRIRKFSHPYKGFVKAETHSSNRQFTQVRTQVRKAFLYFFFLYFVKYKLIKLEFIHCLQQNILTDTLIM